MATSNGVSSIVKRSDSSDSYLETFQSTPKKAKKISRVLADILETGNVTIKQLLSYNGPHNENGTLVAVITAASGTTPDHRFKHRCRRRIILADHTGQIVSYVHPSPFQGQVGDVLMIKDFNLGMKRMNINKNTILGRGPVVDVSENSKKEGERLLREPIHHFYSMESILVLVHEPGYHISMKAKITKVTEMIDVPCSKVVPTPSGRILRKELEVEDDQQKRNMAVFLYDNAALVDVGVGYGIEIHDSPLYTSNRLGTKSLSVYNSDNIILTKPEQLIKHVTITSVEPADNPNLLSVIIYTAGTCSRRDISRDCLVESLDDAFRLCSADDLRRMCPMNGRAHIYGGDINRLAIHSISDHLTQQPVDFVELHEQAKKKKQEDDEILKALQEDMVESTPIHNTTNPQSAVTTTSTASATSSVQTVTRTNLTQNKTVKISTRSEKDTSHKASPKKDSTTGNNTSDNIYVELTPTPDKNSI